MHKIISEDINEIISSNIPWEKFQGKTILISGASGFLPSYIVHTLMSLNKHKRISSPLRIIALVRNEIKAKERFADYLSDKNFNFFVHDVSKSLEGLLKEEIHYIIHAASQASPKYYGVDPVGTLSANIFGTANLLKLAQKNPIESFLYFSSGEVYGQVNESINEINETDYGYVDPISVRSCYAESKRMAETMCVSWQKQFGVPVKIVRPFHTYGPGMQLDDGRVFADFVADMVNNRDIVMKSDGSAVRAFCYLSDATIGFFTVLFHGELSAAYNVSNDKAIISIFDLAEKLITLFPEKNLKVIKKEPRTNSNEYLKSSITRNIPSIKKINALGWSPIYSIEEGFKRTILSFIDEPS